MNGIRLGRVLGDYAATETLPTMKKKEAAACLGSGFLLQGAVSSEGEGALAEAVHGVRLLAVGEQGLSG